MSYAQAAICNVCPATRASEPIAPSIVCRRLCPASPPNISYRGRPIIEEIRPPPRNSGTLRIAHRRQMRLFVLESPTILEPCRCFPTVERPRGGQGACLEGSL